MRTLIFLALIFSSALVCHSQSFRGLDKSPADIAYLPDNFAHDRKPGEKAIAKVVYGRPLKKDRVIFGGIVPFDEVWRTGANENTEITFYQDVKFGDSDLKAGTYSLFTIPGKESWTIILNSDVNYWGAYSYDKEHDVIRITAIPKENTETVEAFTIQFKMSGEESASMIMAWDNVQIEVPIEFAEN